MKMNKRLVAQQLLNQDPQQEKDETLLVGWNKFKAASSSRRRCNKEIVIANIFNNYQPPPSFGGERKRASLPSSFEKTPPLRRYKSHPSTLTNCEDNVGADMPMIPGKDMKQKRSSLDMSAIAKTNSGPTLSYFSTGSSSINQKKKKNSSSCSKRTFGGRVNEKLILQGKKDDESLCDATESTFAASTSSIYDEDDHDTDYYGLSLADLETPTEKITDRLRFRRRNSNSSMSRRGSSGSISSIVTVKTKNGKKPRKVASFFRRRWCKMASFDNHYQEEEEEQQPQYFPKSRRRSSGTFCNLLSRLNTESPLLFLEDENCSTEFTR